MEPAIFISRVLSFSISTVSQGCFQSQPDDSGIFKLVFSKARWFSLAPLLVIVCCYVRGSPSQGALEWRVSFLGLPWNSGTGRFINEGYPAAHAAISLFGAPQTNSPSSTMWFLHINKAGSSSSHSFFSFRDEDVDVQIGNNSVASCLLKIKIFSK